MDRQHDARPSPAQQPDPPQGAVRAGRSGQCADVCVRADGLRPRASRQRAPGGGVRCRSRGCCGGCSRASHTCATSPTWTTRSTRARRRSGEPIARDHRAHHGGFPRRHGGARRAAAGREPRATGAYRRDDHDDRAADRLAATPMRPRGTCCSRSPRSPITASCRAAAMTNCSPARGSRSRRTSATPAISCCGSRRRDDLPGWDSPWGRGRPGWHIECSAMSWRISARRSTSTAAAAT